MKNIYLTNRFFFLMAGITIVMMLSYAFPFLLPFAQTGLMLLIVMCLIDGLLLFNKRVIFEAEREVPLVLSLGDDNVIKLLVINKSTLTFSVEIIDELPEQFQARDFKLDVSLPPNTPKEIHYELRPVSRGEYRFGDVVLFLTTTLALLKRRIIVNQEKVTPVYPSILQMKRYELKSFDKMALEYGLKKVRKIGHSYEFEHIRQYMRGDDYRSINWKATGRRAQLMVNQYEDEKSQQIYCLIDKSRVMHMPFNGLSLFDYAVNASLVISNIALQKQDRTGLITFAETTKSVVIAERSKTQLKKILETLYKENEGMVETNFENLYMAVRKFVNGRSLLFLYTNFESSYALQRALPQLRKLNDQHLLVVIFFENTEISTITTKESESLEEVYTQITAEQYMLTKVQVMNELKQFGIFSVLTKPEQLTVAVINKYLELKSRGLI